ncbi:MAG: aerobic carbon-monoxide dehydrogenase medium subunit [Nocardioidaceae bacterium]|nr:aerobic carbon-monoxide dehydrogenase medium subunit [Nocardioidaceae bacterium]
MTQVTGFIYAAPTTVAEALTLLREHGDEATVLAGGQSLMILVRQRLITPTVLVGLKRVAELKGLEAHDGCIQIGSMVSYRSAARSPLLREHLPTLAEASGSVGSVHIRNLGTLGGSVCHADPAGDVPTVLLSCDATLVLKTPDGGEVRHPLDDFFTGLFETRREPEELLVSIEVPAQPADATTSYRRYSFREGEYPLCVIACRLEWDGETCSGARVAVGGGGTHPMRLHEVEQRLTGQDRGAIDAPAVAQEARASLRPVPDVRGSTEWKATVVAHVLEQALTEALTREAHRA